MKAPRSCARCVMDETAPDIHFDEKGVCEFCRGAEASLAAGPLGWTPEEKRRRLEALTDDIRRAGRGKRYDCVIGVSGGVDSTYAAYVVKRILGLRPLAVHLDNGWDAETAVSNIEKALQALDIELFTHVLDWESFKDLQVAFLKASTPDAEIPTDHAIFSLLYDIAAREGVRYILGGTNQQTESVMPRAWSWGHNDWRYIRSIHEEFGTRPLKRYPHRTLWKTAWYRWVRRIRWVGILNYVDYIKEDAAAVLEREIGWRPYGAKHHESIYTRFYQEHILPVKFGFDKRKAHLSSLIVSGQMTREAALRELAKPLSPDARSLEADTEYVVGKLGLTRPEFERLMALPPRRFEDYPSYESYPPVQFLRRVYRRLKGRPV